MGGAKPAFNMHSALTGGLGGSNGVLKNHSFSNIILGGMSKPPPPDKTGGTQYNGTPYVGGNTTLINGVDPDKNNNSSL